MKFNLYDGLFKFECDWKAVAAIAVCVLGFAIIKAL